MSAGRRTSRRAGSGAGGSRKEASRIASAKAMRSLVEGGAGANSVWSLTICHPCGTVTDLTCAAHRSNAPGSAAGDSGPITAVASSYPYVIVATAGSWQD